MIISDIRMPGMDGVAFDRQNPEGATGYASDSYYGIRRKWPNRYFAAGAFAFLNKPIDPIFIVALLQQALTSDVPSRPDLRGPEVSPRGGASMRAHVLRTLPTPRISQQVSNF